MGAVILDGPRSRFHPLPVCGLALGPRDEALLTALFLNRTMTRGQIQALFFSSVPRCNARLRQLYDWGYLSRAYLPTAPFGSQGLYSVGKSALPLIALYLDRTGIRADEADVAAQCRRPALSLLEHTLAVGDVYVAAQKATALRPHVRLDHWLPERFCRHGYEVRRADGSTGPGTGRWRKEVFQPDAFLRLTRGDASAAGNFFLEVDRGHTNSRQFAGKLRTHAHFLGSGLFADVFGWPDFHTLVVTTGQKRLDNLRALAEREGSTLFWFTTSEAVDRSGILAPIWRAPFTADALELI